MFHCLQEKKWFRHKPSVYGPVASAYPLEGVGGATSVCTLPSMPASSLGSSGGQMPADRFSLVSMNHAGKEGSHPLLGS